MHRKILHGLDGSEGSFKALREAINLAKVYNASLYTLTVEELPSNPETVGEIAEEKEGLNEKHKEMMLKVDELAEKEGVEIHPVVLIGHEVKTFLELIRKEGFDLLIIGFMGHSALYDRVMGSTCQSLVRLAPCSVLVVK